MRNKFRFILFLTVTLYCFLLAITSYAKTFKEQMDEFVLKQRQESAIGVQKRQEIVRQFTEPAEKNIQEYHEAQKEADKRRQEGLKRLQKIFPDLVSPEETNQAQEQNQQGQTTPAPINLQDLAQLPECDCEDPNYNYPSNFYYNYQHQKIVRLYPTKCRCAPTQQGTVVSSAPSTPPVSVSVPPTTTNKGTTTSEPKQEKFDIQY
ncbi:MAG: hypothetical protein JW855_05570 [Gammaproteobacteria bacterium]|nr:hypothetical protein [Gammaproteobacteria bacterium]